MLCFLYVFAICLMDRRVKGGLVTEMIPLNGAYIDQEHVLDHFKNFSHQVKDKLYERVSIAIAGLPWSVQNKTPPTPSVNAFV